MFRNSEVLAVYAFSVFGIENVLLLFIQRNNGTFINIREVIGKHVQSIFLLNALLAVFKI